MTLTATQSEGKDFELIPTGLHPAICCWVIDLGHQDTPWGLKEKVMITWELPKLLIETKDNGMMPRVISRELAPSLGSYNGKMSNLTNILIGWFGKSPETSLDLSTLVGQKCMVNIAHREHNGNTYANVVSVTPPTDECKSLELKNEKIIYEINNGPIPEQLPEWIRVKIMRSQEFMGPDDRDINQAPAPSDDDLPF